MINIAICDDDARYIRYIKQKLKEAGLSEREAVFYEYMAGSELLNAFPEIELDLLILDIQMIGMNGNEVAQKFREKYINTILVFCSGVYNPTPESFKVSPYRYLLKQYTDEKMLLELREIVDFVKKKKEVPSISVHYFSNTVELKPEEILYISIAKRGSRVCVCPNVTRLECEERFISNYSVKQLYEVLKDYDFAYAHNSYIVNMKHVKSKTLNDLEMINGDILTISRARRKEFHKRMADYFESKYI